MVKRVLGCLQKAEDRQEVMRRTLCELQYFTSAFDTSTAPWPYNQASDPLSPLQTRRGAEVVDTPTLEPEVPCGRCIQRMFVKPHRRPFGEKWSSRDLFTLAPTATPDVQD